MVFSFAWISRSFLLTSRELDNGDEAIALLKYVDRRIGTSAGRCIPEPITFQAGIESSLETEQGFEWIAKSRDHGRTPQMPPVAGAVRVAGAQTQFAPFGRRFGEPVSTVKRRAPTIFASPSLTHSRGLTI